MDVAFVGIGENGHLAFNDPPADFETLQPYIIVALDTACRQQQVGEGWFATVDDVPTHAISMSVQQILKSREIVCVVPEARKAQGRQSVRRRRDDSVRACVDSAHPRGRRPLFLDGESAACLPTSTD